MLRRMTMLLVLSLSLLLTVNALAQDEMPAEADAPEGESSEVAEEVAQDDFKARFRWGISGAGGPMLGKYRGGAGDLTLRLGAQITPMIGVYAQPILLVGAGYYDAALSSSASAVAGAGVGVLVDFSFFDLLYVAVGPEILRGAAAAASATSQSGEAGTFFSINARAGIVLGPKRPEKRKGFMLGLDLHVTFFHGEPAVMPLIALGYEMF